MGTTSTLSLQEQLRTRTKKFAVRVVALCDSLPAKPSSRAIGSQLIRSGMSVAANYRAAQRARTKPEFISKIGIVVEEADETQFWLEMLVDSGIVPSGKLEPLMREAAELTAIFTKSRETARGR